MRHRRYVRVMNLWYDTGPIPEFNPSALGLLCTRLWPAVTSISDIYRERLDDSEELKNAGYTEIEIYCVESQGSLEKDQSLCIQVLIFKLSIPHDHEARGAAIWEKFCPTFIALLMPCPGPIPDKSISGIRMDIVFDGGQTKRIRGQELVQENPIMNYPC